jgi:simple sugar transport system substrate-binding protein
MNDKQTAGPTKNSLSRRGMLGATGAAGLGAAVAALAAGCSSTGTDSAKAAASPGSQGSSVYYWVSHGAPGDQIWVMALHGAQQAGKDLGVTVRTSLMNNNVAAQESAITSAIAADAAGIATTSPQANVLGPLVAQAKAAGIPVVTFNVDDASSGRTAFIGPNSIDVGKMWAQYLVQNKLVKPGNTVFLPVEQAGAAYQVLETSGINSVFQPLGIKANVFQAGADPAASTTAMQNYLTAHPDVAAMIGLGDQVTSNTENVFKALGWAPGKIPVVGWGNTLASAQAVQQGYIKTALWQYPDSQGYLPISLLKMISDGFLQGYDVETLKFYDSTTVSSFMKFLH